MYSHPNQVRRIMRQIERERAIKAWMQRVAVAVVIIGLAVAIAAPGACS